ncbi:hypothetical protein HMPREF0731_3478 [Pseudoroseomonas cervicalis ATCC 49957]|uniref:Uncharacterized protein n=1 Tax=Pseudoroseomonas cervicalis ATCC 49957 TaxID=525371 RepID=D5RQW6_9PROT|nr:hypothetical protein HMPREF0731_3478 [Pseudoroseomonas cervicalis ATCC 49957]
MGQVDQKRQRESAHMVERLSKLGIVVTPSVTACVARPQPHGFLGSSGSPSGFPFTGRLHETLQCM